MMKKALDNLTNLIGERETARAVIVELRKLGMLKAPYDLFDFELMDGDYDLPSLAIKRENTFKPYKMSVEDWAEKVISEIPVNQMREIEKGSVGGWTTPDVKILTALHRAMKLGIENSVLKLIKTGALTDYSLGFKINKNSQIKDNKIAVFPTDLCQAGQVGDTFKFTKEEIAADNNRSDIEPFCVSHEPDEILLSESNSMGKSTLEKQSVGRGLRYVNYPESMPSMSDDELTQIVANVERYNVKFGFKPLTNDALCISLQRKHNVSVVYNGDSNQISAFMPKQKTVHSRNLNRAICLAIAMGHGDVCS